MLPLDNSPLLPQGRRPFRPSVAPLQQALDNAALLHAIRVRMQPGGAAFGPSAGPYMPPVGPFPAPGQAPWAQQPYRPMEPALSGDDGLYGPAEEAVPGSVDDFIPPLRPQPLPPPRRRGRNAR